MNIDKKQYRDAENETLYALELYKNKSTGNIEYRSPNGTIIKIADKNGLETFESTLTSLESTVNALPAAPTCKVYKALLTQTGTSAPVATILENTFDSAPVWARVGVGNYTATLAGAFTADKTVVNGQTKFTGNATCLGVLGDLAGNLYYTYFDMFEEPDKVNFYLYPSNFSGNVELSNVMGTSPLYIEIYTFGA